MPPRPKRNLSRLAIAQAALALLEEHPHRDLTLREVARALQVKPSSLYNHVQGLDELHEAVAALGWGRLDMRLGDVFSFGVSETQALTAVAHCVRSFGHTCPALYRLMFSVAGGEHSGPCSVQGGLSSETRDALSALWVHLAGDTGSADGRVHAQRAFWAFVHGFVMLESSHFFAGLPEADESFVQGLARLLETGHVLRTSGGSFVA